MCSVNWDDWIRRELDQLAANDLKRELKVTSLANEPICEFQGKQMLNLSSNNYLGLANHPQLMQAMDEAMKYGAGSPSSRLIVGHDHQIEMLEEELAEWQETEAALVFSNGYMANLGILATFLRRRDAVFSDQYNHASIVDGIKLSGAMSYRYRHKDMDHLEKLLRRADEKGYKRKLIVTDAVFSMDGDVAPLKEIVTLKERYGAVLLLDEAHSSGVMGPFGKGLVHQLGIANQVELIMGTFSKAFGVYGAFLAGKQDWIRYLIHTCRSFIYTTALPPVVIGTIRKALELVKDEEHLREELDRKSKQFRATLYCAGFDLAGSSTQIVPIVLGESAVTLAFSEKLKEKGILAVPIRPPTVPVGKARLRFSLMATHQDESLEEALQTIIQTAKECGMLS